MKKQGPAFAVGRGGLFLPGNPEGFAAWQRTGLNRMQRVKARADGLASMRSELRSAGRYLEETARALEPWRDR